MRGKSMTDNYINKKKYNVELIFILLNEVERNLKKLKKNIYSKNIVLIAMLIDKRLIKRI